MLFLDFIEFLIFPGLVAVVILAITSSWLVRKLAARFENRVGPPFNQPAYDVAKLMAKERIYPSGSIRWIMHYFPRFQVFVALLMAFFIPITGDRGLLSFNGDIYFFIFLLAIHGSTTFFIGWASRNPYALSGAGRAVLTELSFEIPLAISLAGMSIMTGTMRISEMTQNVWISIFQNDGSFKAGLNWLFIIPWILLLVTAVYSTIGALELNPFSAAHAETEIVAGWNTELTGSDLAYTKLADIVNLFNLAGIITAIYLGGPVVIDTNPATGWAVLLTVLVAFLTFILKVAFVVFLIAMIATLSSRLRIDQITQTLWVYFLPVSMIGILLILLVQQIGG